MGLSAIFDRHARLVGRMTDTLGVDLVEATQRGQIGEQGLRSAIVACSGCTQAGDCEAWLDAHDGGAEAPPDYCRNRALFARIG